jgi:hypothetical protein
MINLEHVVLASPEQMEFVIEGMRNPMNSWGKSDSNTCRQDGSFCMECGHKNDYCLGENDHSLMQKLSDAGTEHRKYMRMIPVYVRITAPLYWWKEFDTYKVGTVANSCSTMHKIQEKEFTLEDFSCEHLTSWSLAKFRSVLEFLNIYRNTYLYGGEDLLEDGTTVEYKPKDKNIWWQMIQLLPSSYNQTRNVMLNYEVLANIYRQRKNHKLDEWREFCKWIESLPYSEFVTGEIKESIPETTGDIKQAFGILKSAGIKLTKEQLEKLRKNGVFCYPVADPKKKETEEDTDQTDSFPIIDGEGAKVYDTREYAKEHPEWSEKIRRMVREDNN